jgi:small subunit ribosomal protein S4
MVGHKFIAVNGRCVNIPSYQVKAGDVIEVVEKKRSMQRVKDILEVTSSRIMPEWLEFDEEQLKGTVKELPSRDQIDVPVDEMLIVELYSK